ncbi:hypothetical protein [Paenibacillus tundrae]|uniref:hypothetical protein n=1 Tax=Paenibacillus tundrae TaxID=528187 RepID=UPI0030D5905D
MQKGWPILIFLGALLLITGCSSGRSVTADDVIAKLEKLSIEAENPRKVTEDGDMSLKPETAELVRFELPSLKGSSATEGSENSGFVLKDIPSGHIFIFENTDDLATMENIYEELGITLEMFRSLTYAKDNILLQVPATMPEEEFNKYKEFIDSL